MAYGFVCRKNRIALLDHQGGYVDSWPQITGDVGKYLQRCRVMEQTGYNLFITRFTLQSLKICPTHTISRT